ncbi:MAG: hypothetical protein H6837_04595 [Planctomycetes bacterium]|nr:hypothetical protein [Planctomycetota bacterium]
MRSPVLGVLLLGASLVAACTSESVPSPAAAATKPADDADCNFETPLVPGVPGSPGHLIKSARNPNGASELAVLMRRFVDDLEEARRLLGAGKPTRALFATHRKMRCAWPTDPSERTRAFDDRARAYLAQVQAFDAHPTKQTYNAVLSACKACHEVSCPGPLDLIGKLRM